MVSEYGIEVVRFDTIDSTNREALSRGAAGAPGGTVIVAQQQTGGRGRLARTFVSPPGGLYCSLILQPVIDFSLLSSLTIAAGVACGRILESVSGATIHLKWPNDLYIGRRKLGGILTETAPVSHLDGRIPFIVIGMGININTDLMRFPPPLQDRVTSLYYEMKERFDTEALMMDIVTKLLHFADDIAAAAQEIHSWWRKRDYLAGKRIQWNRGNNRYVRGLGAGLLADGSYRLLTDDNATLSISGGTLDLIGTEEG